ncbi:hypothetical protein Leryth_026080 [Lithospermum erythrorhizon]|nr:hypothetical protein Leryth_026080 [Lithospermum erythrorhizon]
MGSVALPRRLEGKVALITGASQGIGEHIAKMFIKNGAIVANADIVPPSATTEDSFTADDQILYIRCDVTKEFYVEDAVKTVVDKYGKLDIMINNAAVADPPKKCVLDNDLDDFERVIRVNVTGVFLGIKHAATVMIPARGGTIINLGSISSILGGQTSHAYSSSKHAVVGLTKNAAAELGQYGIRVNCLSSSALATPLTKMFFNMDKEGQHEIYSNLTGKILDLDDLAYGALYLASEESKYVSGHNLTIDGGYTVTNPAFGLFSRINL